MSILYMEDKYRKLFGSQEAFYCQALQGFEIRKYIFIYAQFYII